MTRHGGPLGPKLKKTPDAFSRTWPHDPALVPADLAWHYDRNGEAGSRELLERVLHRNPRRIAMGPRMTHQL
jgi:hypothetical protein